MADVFTDHKIALRWPEKWAKCRRSRDRKKLRDRYKYVIAFERLQEKGASCANRKHFGTHFSVTPPTICELHSDFHGYQMADADGLCTDWKGKENVANARGESE